MVGGVCGNGGWGVVKIDGCGVWIEKVVVMKKGGGKQGNWRRDGVLRSRGVLEVSL